MNKYQFTILKNLNSENKLLYSKTGRNLYNQTLRDSHTSALLVRSFLEIYLIKAPSNIGIINLQQ